MVRIIAGYYKGRIIKTNRSPLLRPTQDRVKETLFAVLGNIEDYLVADLFAGSGNLGLEALSRRAQHCVMVENDLHQVALIRENARAMDIEDLIDIKRTDVLRFLDKIPKLDLILADPPYDYRYFDRLFQALQKLTGGIRIALEASRDMALPDDLKPRIASQKNIGETVLYFWES
jgi:16S rRNA (guanine966-N2)-methyltransferase